MRAAPIPLLLLAYLFAAAATTSPVAASPLVAQRFIYETAPFPQCHASTIVQATDGGLVAAWFGGTRESHPDVGIWISRFEQGRWSIPVEVANGAQPDGTRHPTYNPVLFQPAQGPLTLFYKVGSSVWTWWGMRMTSNDGGRTWSRPEPLAGGIAGPSKNKPLQMPDGTVVAGSETGPRSKPHESLWRLHFLRSEDAGRSWSMVGGVAHGAVVSALQPTLLPLGGQALLALGRTRQGRIFEVRSEDAGRTWGEVRLSELPNSNAGIDAVKLRDGRYLLVYNHSESKRYPLNVAISTDARTWRMALTLDDAPNTHGYAYPAVIQSRDGLVHITYTWDRARIRHAIIDPSAL